MHSLFFLPLLFFLTAILYSSVGFGGGTTYVALLSFFAIHYTVVPKVALICNILVVTSVLLHAFKAKTLSLKLVLPFCLTSVPFAYFGGQIPVSKEVFLLLLCGCLFIAGTWLLFSSKVKENPQNIQPIKAWAVGLPIGGILGFISGIVGIGGGIFLAPLMYFWGWGNSKQIAASSGFFIFVNSISGFLGQLSKPVSGSEWYWIFPLMAAVIVGGQIGSRLSISKLAPLHMQRLTSSVVLLAAVRIFLGIKG